MKAGGFYIPAALRDYKAMQRSVSGDASGSRSFSCAFANDTSRRDSHAAAVRRVNNMRFSDITRGVRAAIRNAARATRHR